MEKVAKIQEARVDECLPKIKEVAEQITLPCSAFLSTAWDMESHEKFSLVKVLNVR